MLQGLKLVLEVMTWSAVVVAEEWSEDNSAEIASGLIHKADTIAELAAKIGIEVAVLEEQVARYNASCAAGNDEVFGRNAETLLPVANGPFYALPIYPGDIGTNGGLRTNARAQVVDDHGAARRHRLYRDRRIP